MASCPSLCRLGSLGSRCWGEVRTAKCLSEDYLCEGKSGRTHDWAEKKQITMQIRKHLGQPNGELWNKDHPMNEPHVGQKWPNRVARPCSVTVCVDPEGSTLQRWPQPPSSEPGSKPFLEGICEQMAHIRVCHAIRIGSCRFPLCSRDGTSATS